MAFSAAVMCQPTFFSVGPVTVCQSFLSNKAETQDFCDNFTDSSNNHANSDNHEKLTLPSFQREYVPPENKVPYSIIEAPILKDIDRLIYHSNFKFSTGIFFLIEFYSIRIFFHLQEIDCLGFIFIHNM